VAPDTETQRHEPAPGTMVREPALDPVREAVDEAGKTKGLGKPKPEANPSNRYQTLIDPGIANARFTQVRA